MGNYTLATRALAARSYSMARGHMALAQQLFLEGWQRNTMDSVKDIPGFIRYQVKKVEETGTLADRPHPPRTKLVDDDLAMECSMLLKAGYLLHPTNRFGQLIELEPIHLYYTSIRQAVDTSPFLNAVCADHNVSPEHLLQRMHEVDPTLRYYTVDLKPALSSMVMQERRFAAQQLFNYCCTTFRFLETIFFGDEFTISFIPLSSRTKIKVYCDLNDSEVSHAVVHTPYWDSSKQHIKVRSLIFVNALEGPCAIEMMTGTTAPNRLFNPRQRPYLVSQMTSLHPEQQ